MNRTEELIRKNRSAVERIAKKQKRESEKIRGLLMNGEKNGLTLLCTVIAALMSTGSTGLWS